MLEFSLKESVPSLSESSFEMKKVSLERYLWVRCKPCTERRVSRHKLCEEKTTESRGEGTKLVGKKSTAMKF